MMKPQLTTVFLVGLCACGIFSEALAATVYQRSATDVAPTARNLVSRTCYNSTPCGWMVYVPFTRRNDYFMKNTCECPTGTSCTRSEDDLSVSAYIYRCRDNTPPSETES